jgi:peptidoglycan/LPS O-acetylase OafA/YrhL
VSQALPTPTPESFGVAPQLASLADDLPSLANDAPAPAAQIAATPYRADIDGLRAIAVALTILFHLDLSRTFGGGFVGVDVFFVISGFLITGILLRALHDGEFTLLWFYERRVRRIVPALAALVAGVLAAGYVLLLPGDYRQMARSALRALGASSNLFFLDNTGYFDNAATAMPLLHTWSLGVEEQFYLVWPLLLLVLVKACRGRRGVLGSCLLGVVVTSFVLNVREIGDTPKAAFFLLQTRAWELGAGGLLALCPVLGAGRARRALAEAMPVLGLTLIGWAATTLASDRPYPGYAALLPVLGAMLIVYESGHRTLARRLLGTPPLVFFGKISYSLYLLNWPLIVFWRLYANGSKLTVTSASVLAAVSVVLAWTSWRFVEQPFRRPTLPRRAMFACAGTAVALLVLAAWTVVATDGAIGRIPESARGLGDLDVMWRWTCPQWVALGLPSQEGPAAAQLSCVVGAPWASARSHAVVWGDSFADHLMPLLDAAGNDAGTSIALVRPCPAIFDDVSLQRWWPEQLHYNDVCAAQRAAVIRTLAQHDDIRLVILAGSWATLASLLQQHGGPQITRKDGIPLLGEAIARLLPEIAAPGRRIVLFGDTPRLPMPDPPACAVARVSPLLRDCSADLDLVAGQSAVSAVQPINEMFAAVAGRHPELLFYRPTDYLCDGPRCATEIDGEFLYRDGGHLRRNMTPDTVRKLAARLHLADLLGQANAGDGARP